MFKYTNQPIATAIVPILQGKAGAWHEGYDQSFMRLTGDTLHERAKWKILWGVYAFRDADRVNSAGVAPWTYAEAAMMQTEYVHDFCGGVMGTSASVRFFTGERSYWDSSNSEVRLCRLTPHKWGYANLHQPGVTVPILHDALLADRPLTHGEAQRILSRSLMAASLSVLYSQGKRGLFAMDRELANNGRTREVLQHAEELTFIPSNCPFANVPNVNPYVEFGDKDPADHYEGAGFPHSTITRKTITVGVEEGRTWINHNSGNRVGPVQVFFTLADDFDTQEPDGNDGDDDDREEIYNEETEEYEYVYPDPDPATLVELPDWYLKPLRTVQYTRMFPRNMFNN